MISVRALRTLVNLAYRVYPVEVNGVCVAQLYRVIRDGRPDIWCVEDFRNDRVRRVNHPCRSLPGLSLPAAGTSGESG